MKVCDEYFNCLFVKKYEDSDDLVCKGLIQKYCRSGLNEDCARKNIKQHEVPPDILPTGEKIQANHTIQYFKNRKEPFLRRIFKMFLTI